MWPIKLVFSPQLLQRVCKMANHRLQVVLAAGRQEVTNGTDQTKQYFCAYGLDCMFDLSAVSLHYEPSKINWTWWLWCATFFMVSLYAVTIFGTQQLLYAVTISGTQQLFLYAVTIFGTQQLLYAVTISGTQKLFFVRSNYLWYAATFVRSNYIRYATTIFVRSNYLFYTVTNRGTQ